MTIRKKVSVGAVGMLVAAGLSIGIAPAAQAADYSVSVADYCARNVSSGTGAPSQAVNINNRWDGWRCGTRVGLVGVNMDIACKQQYGRNAKAVAINQTASGWRCRV